MSSPALFQFPPELKDSFTKTDGLRLSDGTNVGSSDIWNFMTEEGVRRFPRSYQLGVQFQGQISQDAEFFSGVKYKYLYLTVRDRIEKARKNDIPTVLVQGGQSYEPYYAAGTIPLRPGFIINWAKDKEEGLDVRGADWRGNSIMEKGRRDVGIEVCNQITAHAAVQEGEVDVDLIAPYLNLRCSDMAYLVEAHRHGKKQIPLQVVDYPIDNPRNTPRAVNLLSQELRKLVSNISQITGRPVPDDDLRKKIHDFNKVRGLAREFEAIWQSADIPPTNSTDLRNLSYSANEPMADVTATLSLLEQAVAEVRDRVERGVRGHGLVEDPVRVFVCGSCVTANPVFVDAVGGVIVGHDDQWSEVLTDVAEEGDPYVNLAKGILSQPYELPTIERAKWTAAEVKRTRADGLMFIYNWGCQFQSTVARMVADIVKKETGVPTLVMSVGELSKTETTEQSQNRIESFIELLRYSR
ncbi:MAG TPA: 2-hydroxyacyl-CoA dehydratase family protein [Methylomusa anaerophila]|uniref:2-hydroxyglutaryl-CoA dehydratase, D-component n=1 Tax=Methylomusa anaerophila TaxID=1930071 RepID=A0A348AG20_9FIRM|nr:2-hydroxyacyl-CoA dehydratase family protein [Methylomusa anaerophila]BBB90018.1 2-hydroxyglutaryl-CoA dehydratase, D-component [Methylomusa anaerophila]HML88253.1 2-hydroxyacyl-CoA dehydratase family protein [Methylomusa anaerophila]